MSASLQRMAFVDSHTAGEPTRVVVSGFPDLGRGNMAERREVFRREFDSVRSAIVNEPRGSDVLVGVLLCEPVDATCAAGVVFFNNVGVLNMCGHGTIGLAVTLAHLGRIQPGTHRLETPVGVVSITLHDAHRVTIENVPSFRHATGVSVTVPGHGIVKGDVAWGGNWFFLADAGERTLDLAHAEELTLLTRQIAEALHSAGIAGAEGGQIDHIELQGPAHNSANHARNFVLCPGMAFDRSPCGTGTSAKVACLHADGKLQPGEIWRQEGILGTVFEGSYRMAADRVVPSITGSAYVTAEGALLIDRADPFASGIRQ